ncbi:TPA: hypothetical protein OQU49_004171 [Shigella flexneri]|nr:hypothetical protein [Shigella flexneri]
MTAYKHPTTAEVKHWREYAQGVIDYRATHNDLSGDAMEVRVVALADIVLAVRDAVKEQS